VRIHSVGQVSLKEALPTRSVRTAQETYRPISRLRQKPRR
jgi:hypothetical protein